MSEKNDNRDPAMTIRLDVDKLIEKAGKAIRAEIGKSKIQFLDAGLIEKPESVHVLFLQRERYEFGFDTVGVYRTEEAAIHVASRVLDDARGRGLEVRRSMSENPHWTVGCDSYIWIEEVPFGKPSKVRF